MITSKALQHHAVIGSRNALEDAWTVVVAKAYLAADKCCDVSTCSCCQTHNNGCVSPDHETEFQLQRPCWAFCSCLRLQTPSSPPPTPPGLSGQPPHPPASYANIATAASWSGLPSPKQARCRGDCIGIIGHFIERCNTERKGISWPTLIDFMCRQTSAALPTLAFDSWALALLTG